MSTSLNYARVFMQIICFDANFLLNQFYALSELRCIDFPLQSCALRCVPGIIVFTVTTCSAPDLRNNQNNGSGGAPSNRPGGNVLPLQFTRLQYLLNFKQQDNDSIPCCTVRYSSGTEAVEVPAIWREASPSMALRTVMAAGEKAAAPRHRRASRTTRKEATATRRGRRMRPWHATHVGGRGTGALSTRAKVSVEAAKRAEQSASSRSSISGEMEYRN